MSKALAWCAANSCLFALLAAWVLLAFCLDRSVRYASTLLSETHSPDPFNSDSLLTIPASSADADPHGIIAATRFVRTHFAATQFMPAMTIPLLVVVTPRRCPTKAKRGDCLLLGENSNLDDQFLNDLNTTLWWAALELCVVANNLSSTIIVSPFGNPNMVQHFPKLLSSDNSSVNAFMWLSSTAAPAGSSAASTAAQTASESAAEFSAGGATTTEFNQHAQLRRIVQRCFDYINVSQPAYVERVESFHVHEALEDTRASLIDRWPACIIIMATAVALFVSLPAARTLVRAETKTVFVSLLRARARDSSENPPHQQQQQQQPHQSDGVDFMSAIQVGAGAEARGASGGAGLASASGRSDDDGSSPWSDMLILDVACGRLTPTRALQSLVRQYSRSMSGFDSEHSSTNNLPPPQMQQHPHSPTVPRHISFRPSLLRQLFIHLWTFLWFLAAGGALPFCVVIAGVRLSFTIRGTGAADQRELSSSYFFPALLLTAFLPLAVVHLLLIGRVVDAFFVRDVHADFASFLKQELVWARLWFTPDGWWLAASATGGGAADDAGGAGGGTTTSPRAKGSKLWSMLGGMFGGDDARSPSLLSPTDSSDLPRQNQQQHRRAGGGGGHPASDTASIPSRFRGSKAGKKARAVAAAAAAAAARSDDDDDSIGDGLLPRRSSSDHGYGTIRPHGPAVEDQHDRQQRGSDDEDGDDEDDDGDEDEDGADASALGCGERCVVAAAPVVSSLFLPLLIALRAFLHCPTIQPEKAARRFLSPLCIGLFLAQCAVGSVLLAEGSFALVGAASLVCAASMVLSIGLMLPALSAASLGSLVALSSWYRGARHDPALSPRRQARPRFEHSSCIHAAFCAYQREEQQQQQREDGADDDDNNNNNDNNNNAGRRGVAAAFCAGLLSCLCCGSVNNNVLVALSHNRGKRRRLRGIRWLVLVLLVLVPFALAALFFARLRLDACGWEQFLPAAREQLRRGLLRDGRSAALLPFASIFATLTKDGVWTEAFFSGMAQAHFLVNNALVASVTGPGGIGNATAIGAELRRDGNFFVNRVMWDISRNNARGTTLTAIEGLVDALNPFDPSYGSLVQNTVNAARSAALSFTVPPFDPFGSVASGSDGGGSSVVLGTCNHDSFVRQVNAGLTAAGGGYLPADPASTSTAASTAAAANAPTFLTAVVGGTAPFIVALYRMRSVVAFYWPILAGSIAFILFALWSRVDFRIVSVLRHQALRKRLMRESTTLSGARRRKNRKNRSKQRGGDTNESSDFTGDDDGGDSSGVATDSGISSGDETSASTLALPDEDETDASDASFDANRNVRRGSLQQGQQQQHQHNQHHGRNRRNSSDLDSNGSNRRRSRSSKNNGGAVNGSVDMRGKIVVNGNIVDDPHAAEAERQRQQDNAAGQAFMARMKTTLLVVLCLFFNSGLATAAGLAAASLHASLYTPGCDCSEQITASGLAAGNSSASFDAVTIRSRSPEPRLSWQLIRAAFFPGLALVFFVLECCDLWSFVMLPFQNRAIDVDKLLQLVAQHAQARIEAIRAGGGDGSGDGSGDGVGVGDGATASGGFYGTYQQYLQYASEQRHAQSLAAAAVGSSPSNSPRVNPNASFASNGTVDSNPHTVSGGTATGAGAGVGGSGGSVAGRSAAVEACGANSLEYIGSLAAAAMMFCAATFLVVSRLRSSTSSSSSGVYNEASDNAASSDAFDDVPVVTQFWFGAMAAAAWKLFVVNTLVHAAQRHMLLNLGLF